MEPPAPSLLPDLLGRAGTDGGRKARKHLPFSTADQAWPETETQEVKLLGDLSIVLFGDVTTNNLGLFWMKLKFAFSKASF
jgi:hypothetical protein